ncbi:D-alanyl-D-alanine carboxypeptidase/D-alanyl-D-alanine-endopeptidase [Danxiaibacter flavus]|uniref:D-alanyl-D-alanine carboxypeptidase/D-alanyl-D-alanine-endopeptidase n=1 Tax=Danxiaibacter flavus TaxID=3049108 RepID=A0ABV3ZEY6_9BACT|nr:D-alanyl-D-alanine carboxypeptidase/D-alanyl-D-alanine-endopeptidase [Chitinophagaceae bacterium DXS]
MLFTGKSFARLFLFGLQALSVMHLTSCSVSKKIGKQAEQKVVDKQELTTAHVGIALYDVQSGKFLYKHNSDKYFIPASNTKLLTCYAAMKYLGDSIEAAKVIDTDTALLVEAAGDPTFLHPDFKTHPLLEVLKSANKKIVINTAKWNEIVLGAGWSWDDYSDDYMVERSAFPLHGNFVTFSIQGNQLAAQPVLPDNNIIRNASLLQDSFSIKRDRTANTFYVSPGRSKKVDVPFVVNGINTAVNILRTNYQLNVSSSSAQLNTNAGHVIYSQPVDSLLKNMMYRSDNFYADQTLLMVANKRLGIMNQEAIVDTLLHSDLKNLPQPPQWVDGSGLSRFTLVSPEDFVVLLRKMHNEVDWKRITAILPTGGSGTLGTYYKTLNGKIYAKTGSLSNNLALSGYLITHKNKLLIFSVLINNHMGNVRAIRKDVEAFLTGVAEMY